MSGRGRRYPKKFVGRVDRQSQQYSPGEVSREASQKKKNEHQQKNKKRSRAWEHNDTTTMINFRIQHEVLFNVKHSIIWIKTVGLMP